jgi:hypothetical protein
VTDVIRNETHGRTDRHAGGARLLASGERVWLTYYHDAEITLRVHRRV